MAETNAPIKLAYRKILARARLDARASGWFKENGGRNSIESLLMFDFTSH